MEKYKADADVFKAFCDPNRLKIIDMIRNEEKCACVLLEEFALSQSGLSYHMKILIESGLVVARQDGKWMYYSISEEGRDKVIRLLQEYINI